MNELKGQSLSGLLEIKQKAEQKIGERFVPLGKGVNELTFDVVRRWVYAIEEADPSYLDPASATKDGFATTRVPPSVLLLVARGPSYEMYGFPPGVASIHGESKFSFHRDFELGDHISCTAWISGLRETESSRLGPLLVIDTHNEYVDRNGETVATQDHVALLYEAESAVKKAGGASVIEVRIEDAPELNASDAGVNYGTDKGSLTYSSVEEGDEIMLASMGPLRIDQFARYVMGGGPPKPGPDPAAVHYDPWFALASGLDDVVDMGAWRTALFTQFALRAVSPRGRVTSIRNRYDGWVYRGDRLDFRARVEEKREDSGVQEVDLTVWNERGDGIPVTTGELTLTFK